MCVCVHVHVKARSEKSNKTLIRDDIPYTIDRSRFLQHIGEESQRDDAFHYTRYTVVESATTDGQSSSKNRSSDSIR